MRRRQVLVGISGMLALTHLSRAQGYLQNVSVAHPTVVRQKCAEWCWAASASMIFAMNGHPTDQQTIVSAVFGGPKCLPAGKSSVIGSVLSASWQDDGGDAFQSSVVAAYDSANGINAINNFFILSELSNNRPLLYANSHHAMVVVGVKYIATPAGPDVREVSVLDPWPYSPGIHPLQFSEIIPNILVGGQMSFLAAVHVS
jgi:hypothetical protein